MNDELLDLARVRAELDTGWLGQEIIYLASTGSTNDVARKLAAASAPAGTVVIADEQTAGRGRMKRRWVAPANTCLLTSVIFRPALVPTQIARLTMLCSLAAVQAIETVTGMRAGIKWPNDLVIGDGPPRKLAGTLTETSLAGDKVLFAIVGLGLNVNVDPAALGPVMTPATSLAAELGRPVSRETLLVEILRQMEALYPAIASGGLREAWAERLHTLGRPVTVTVGENQVIGTAEAVDRDGVLLVRDLAGNLHRIAAGDVTLRHPR